MAAVTAMSSIAYAHYSLYDALPRMASRGFVNVEIGSFGNYCYHFNAGSPAPFELKCMMEDLGLKSIALNWCASSGCAFDEDSSRGWLAEYKKKMVDALEVGFPMMTMHFGSINDRADQDEQRKRATDVYRQLAEHALPLGMKLLLEMPHLYLIHHECESVYKLFDDLDLPNVGLLFDSSHWGVIGFDLDEYLEKLGHRLWHVHLRDSSSVPEADRDRKFVRPAILSKNKYNLTLTPGLGSVDFARLNLALDQIGYKGDVTTEFEYFDMTLDEIERQYDSGLSHLNRCGWSIPGTVRYSRIGTVDRRR